MELTFEQISDLLKIQKKDKEEYAFSLEERQLLKTLMQRQ